MTNTKKPKAKQEVEKQGPRILFADIETTPILAYCWGLFDQNIGLNQIKEDWSILSWSAKWQGEKALLYDDVRSKRNKRDDLEVCKSIWKLLDEADIVVWQNGKAFDHKKLNARFKINGLKPPSGYRQIDTKQIASQNFKFTSNKLEYLSSKLCTTEKSKHKKFPGFEMWSECLNGNLEAFKEMEAYNKADVLALEELYNELQAWQTNPIDFNVFYPDQITNKCNCGSSNLIRWGWRYTQSGKFQRYKCQDCGADHVDRGSANNALAKEKRSGLKRKVT